MANYDFSNLSSFLAPKTSSALNQITQNYQQSQRTSSGSSTPSSTTNSGVKYTTPGASDPAYKAAVASTTPNYWDITQRGATGINQTSPTTQVSGATGSTGTQDTTTPSYSRGGGAAPTTPTTNPYADMQSKLAELTAGLTSMSTQVNTPTPTRHETNIPKARGGVSILDFQNDARNSVQSSIDAINASYVDMLKRQSEEEEDIEGQSRAAAARGGDLQSSAFGAREAKMNVKFGEQREGIEAKRQAAISTVEMQAQQIAQNWANIELANQNQNYDQAMTSYAQNLSLGLEMTSTLGATGTDFNELSPEIQEQLVQSTGTSPAYLQGKMQLAHYDTVKESATTAVNVDGSIQYTYIDPENPEKPTTKTIDANIPTGANIQTVTNGGDIVYEKGGQFYVDSSYSNQIVAGNLQYEANKAQQSGTGTTSTKASNTDLRYINTYMKYLTGNIDSTNANSEEQAIIQSLKVNQNVYPVDFFDSAETGSATDQKRMVDELDRLASGVIYNQATGEYIELTTDQLKKLQSNMKAWASKGDSLNIYNDSQFSKMEF